MNTLFVMVGIPGSGKSTYANTLGFKVVSTDSIREELFGDASDQRNGDVVFSTAFERLNEELKSGNSVVFDATNVRRDARERVLENCKNNYSKAVAVVMNTSLGNCITRNDGRDRNVPVSVIRRMYHSFDPVTEDEKFDEVITVD